MTNPPTLATPDIPRQPDVELTAGDTAVIVVDMQNDFAHPDGTLYGPAAREIVPAISKLLERARASNVPVFFTQDWHGADDPEFAIWPEHARAGTWGAEIVEELAPRDDEARVRKLRYDAFYGTSLDHMLRGLGVRTVVIVGTVANICVLHTAGSAALRWYRVVVPEDGIAALTDFDLQSALRQVSFLYGGTVTTTDGLNFA